MYEDEQKRYSLLSDTQLYLTIINIVYLSGRHFWIEIVNLNRFPFSFSRRIQIVYCRDIMQ